MVRINNKDLRRKSARYDPRTDSHARRTVIIFDADDTLWETQPLYEKAKKVFASKMNALGFDRRKALTLLEEIDARNAGIYGFSRSRFPRSMVQTYRQLCGLGGSRPKRDREREMRRIGESVFLVLPKIYPGTREALRRLRRQFRLVLATKGDAAIQTRRLEALGLKPLFDQVWLLRKKDAHEYRRILRDLRVDPKEVFVVGDSIRSDVNPALELGFRAFWIPRKNWVFEREVIRPGAQVASSVVDVAKKLMAAESMGERVTH